MPTTKKLFEKKGVILPDKGKKLYELKENIGNFKSIRITDEKEVKRLVESSGLKYPQRVLELLQKPNTAVIRIIKQGWSQNGNFYTKEAAQELPVLIQKQGNIQFKDHLEEGTQLDRKFEELVSYAKFSWYDKVTESVYAVVRFPSGKDTNWIFELIQDDPEMVGVSIAAAVYIQEDFTADGKTGDKVEGFAYLDSADYVLFPSAGGVAVEASEVQEKIKKAKEKAKKPPIKWRLKENKKEKELQETFDKVEYKIEELKSFLNNYYRKQAYGAVYDALGALSDYLFECMFWYADDEGNATPEEKIANIEAAFKACVEIIVNLEYVNNPEAMYDDGTGKVVSTTESNKPQTIKEKTMKLSELKEKDPTAYAELQKEAVALANDSLSVETTKEISTLKESVVTLTKERDTKAVELDAYKVKEKLAERETKIQSLIAESKLKKELITETFLKSLRKEEDEVVIKEMIADRAKIQAGFESPNGTIILEGRQFVEDKSKEVNDALLASVAESLTN